jgi:hypothetical protein
MKKTIAIFPIFYLCFVNMILGRTVEIVHIDNDLICYCRPSNISNAVVSVHVYDPTFIKTQTNYLLSSTYPTYYSKDIPFMSRFSLAWSVKNKKLHVIAPDVVSDAMNYIMFQMLMVEDITMPDQEMRSRDDKINIPVYFSNPAQRILPRFGAWRSNTFAVNRLHDSQNKTIIYYALSETNAIARLPMDREKGGGWQPCETPVKFKWMESSLSFTRNLSMPDAEILHSEDFPPDGFTPVGSVRIVGKKVMSDDPKAVFPKDADWLIWESDEHGVGRLCQMREGRWSVCADAPRADAPKLIVINNDSNTVFISYSMGVDDVDVEGSLKKIVAVLKERGLLQETKE